MGRRSINTTKSGKYMNPTDQARKEARKKELKKNKRQRQMVRAAVLKNKDPGQILEEMEKIDEMEYNVMQPSPLNEKVLRDKRKKLKETFDRVMRLYHTEEPEHWAELKRKEVEYEKKRLKKQQYYESVKHAQSVQIDEIPLPSATQATATTTTMPIGLSNRLPPPPTALSLPPFAPSAPPGTLRKTTDALPKPIDKTPELKKKELPGVPPGPPPDLFDLPDLDTDAEDDEVVLKEYNVKSKTSKSKSVNKPNSLQQRMLAISGQNIDEFMKEMESVHRKKEKERAAIQNRSNDKAVHSDNDENKQKTKSDLDKMSAESDSETDSAADDDSDASEPKKHNSKEIKSTTATPAATAAATISSLTPLAAAMPAAHTVHPTPMSIPGPPMPPVAGLPPSMIFRPPPLRPPGMPSFGMRMPPGPPAGMPPRMGIRMPPGPPPGMPPRHHHKGPPPQQHQRVTTITAKPQIRNLSADVTRFVPSTLRVKREDARKQTKSAKSYAQHAAQSNQGMEANKTATKDDAYMQFMNEMQGLL